MTIRWMLVAPMLSIVCGCATTPQKTPSTTAAEPNSHQAKRHIASYPGSADGDQGSNLIHIMLDLGTDPNGPCGAHGCRTTGKLLVSCTLPNDKAQIDLAQCDVQNAANTSARTTRSGAVAADLADLLGSTAPDNGPGPQSAKNAQHHFIRGTLTVDCRYPSDEDVDPGVDSIHKSDCGVDAGPYPQN